MSPIREALPPSSNCNSNSSREAEVALDSGALIEPQLKRQRLCERQCEREEEQEIAIPTSISASGADDGRNFYKSIAQLRPVHMGDFGT